MLETRRAADGADWPVVDVVVPTYGPCPYLGEALRSVLVQTYRAWRLTIVDNSPERGEARAVYEDLPLDTRIRYVATGGLGQAENWNTAFDTGDAPFVAMLHDDDLWDPGFLAARVQALLEHEGCAFVFAGYRWIDEEGRVVSPRPLRVPAGVLQPRAFVPVQYVENVIAPCSVLYRRSALGTLGAGFRADVPYTDYEYWLRIAITWPVCALELIDNANRLHGGSVTNALHGGDVRRAGQLWLEFIDLVEPMVEEALPGVLPVSVRRRRRASALLTCTLDELQLGRRRAALRLLLKALTCRPLSIVDVRVPFIVLLFVLGRRGRTTLARIRLMQHKNHVPVHVGDVATYLQERWSTRHLRSPAR